MADLAAGAAAVMPPSLQEASSYDYTQAPSYAGYKPHSTRTENTSVFVCNLAFKVSEDWLHRLFRKCGEIKSFKLVTDRESGRHKGFGFVEFVTTEGAATAVRTLDGYEVCTRLMRVSFADQDAYKPIAEVGGKFSEMRTARDVLHGFELRKRQLRPNCVVTCWGTLGKLVRQSSEECEWMKAELRQSNALASLLESTLQMVPRLEPTTVATVAYGAASVVSTTGFSLGEQVWEALAAKGLDLANQIRPQGLANLVNAFAKAKHPAPALFDAIALVAPPRMRDFTPQELANTAWAYATAQHSAPALFDAIAAEAAPRVREFEPQTLWNTAWAYVTLHHAAPALLDAIAAEAARQVRDFTPQGLSTTAWAYAKAQHAAPALLDAIAAESRRQVRNFKPQHLANAAWAYATAKQEAPELLEAIAVEAARQVRDFKPQGLSNTAWAYVTAQHSAPALFDAIAAEAARQVRDFKPQELTNTAWAYAKAQHAAPALLDAIAAEARRQVRNFKPQHLANAAWSYATLQHGAPALFDAIAAEAAQRLRDFAPQETSNLAWAYAAADHSSCEVLFGSAAFVAHCKATQAAFMHSSLAQLHQWQLWLEERGIAWPRLPLPLAERCHAAFLSKAQGEPSNLQRHVVRALKALGLEPREEVLTPQGYSLDAVVRIEGCEVAIEVDGPFHFVGRDHWVGSLAGVPPVGVHLTGSTALKRRQLRAAGWALVSLPYWEWNKFESHDARCAPWQRELLLRELGGAVRSSRPHVIKDGGSSSAERFVSRFVREDGDSLHKKRKMEGGMSALPVVVPPPSSILSQLPPSAQMLRGVPMAQHSSGGAGTPRVAHGLAKWECGRCSFLNNGTLTECEMCGRVRVVHITNPLPAPSVRVVHITNPLPAPSPPCSPPSPTTASDTTKLQALPQALTESQPKFPPKNNLKEDERRRWKEMEGEDGRRSFSRRMPRTS